jgi:hypothetical protein
VTGNSVRPTELAEEAFDAVPVLLDMGVHLGVGTLEISVGYQPRPAVPWADDVEHVQVALADQTIPMHIKKVEARCGAPMAQQARLHVVQSQRTLQQRVVFQINLAHGEIIGGTPVGIHFCQLFRAQGTVARRFAHDAPRKGNSADSLKPSSRRLPQWVINVTTG